jgi:drug/metabolite transporter (DMT)-like permease
MKRWLPYATLVLAMILWSTTFVALKYSFRHFSPVLVIFGRMVVAGIVFLPLLPKLYPEKIKKNDIWLISLMAIFEPCLYFIFEAMAIERTTASQAGMITALLPLMVAIGAAFFLSEKVSGKTYAGFILAIGGAIMLSVSGVPEPESMNPVLGNFFEFIAMACATGYTLILKRLSSRYSPFFLTAVQSFCGSLFFGFIFFIKGTGLPSAWPLVPTLVIIYLGIFITMGAYGLYNFGVSKLQASQASIFINLIPVFSVFWAWALLSERFTWFQFISAALILIGVWISQEIKREKSSPAIDATPVLEKG